MRAILPIFLITLLSFNLLAQSGEAELEQVFSSAGRLLEDGSYKEALIDYTRLINSGYENEEIWVKRGLAHYYLREFEDALGDFDEAFRRQVRSPELLGYRALTNYELNKGSGTMTDFEQAFAAGFENARAAFIMGNEYFKTENYPGAIKYYDLAESWGSEDPVLYNNRGKARTRIENLPMALNDFNKALVLQPEYTKARSNRAFLLFREKKMAEARKDLEWLCNRDAYQLSGDEFAMLGFIQLEENEFEASLENLENARRRHAASSGLNKALGQVHAALGNSAKAIGMLELSLEEKGGDKEVLQLLARLYYSEGKYASSRKFSNEARSLDATDTEMQSIYGLSAWHEGDPDEALTVLSVLAGKDILPEVYKVIARIHFERNEFTLAVQAVDRSESLARDIECLRIRTISLFELQKYTEALRSGESWRELDSGDIDSWLYTAKSNMVLGNYASAEAEITKAVALDDSSFEVNALYGEVLLMNKDYTGASKYLSAAIGLKSDPHVHALLGMAEFRRKRYAEAYKNLQIACLANTLSRTGLHDLAVSSFEIQKYEDAENYAIKAVEAGLDEAPVRVVRGLSRFYLGKTEEAEPDLNKAVEEGTTDVRVFEAMGDLSAGKQQYQEAIRWYGKALSGSEYQHAILLKRGNAYVALKDPEKAVTDFSMILTENKDHDKARFARGSAYFRLKQYESATRDLLLVNNKSLDLPVNEMIAISFANLKTDRAGEFLEKSIRLGTREPAIFFHAGVLRSGAKEWDKAVARLEQAEKMGYSGAALYEFRGEAYYHLARYEESLSDLVKSGSNQYLIGLDNYYLGRYGAAVTALTAVSELPEDGLIVLGDAYYREDDRENALRIFDELIAAGKGNAVIHRHRGLVYLSMKEYIKARTDLSHALSLEPGHGESVKALAEVHFQLREYAEVTVLYEQHASVDGILPLAGLSYYEEGKNEAAKKILLEVVRAGAGSAPVEAALGHIYFQSGEFGPAVKSLSRALELDDTQAEWKNWKGLSLFRLGKFDQSGPLLKEAIDAGIDDADTYFAAGVSAYENGNNEAAISLLKNALERGYARPEAGFTMGNAHYKLDQFEEAVKSYDEAIGKGLQDPVLWNNRGRSLEHLDAWEEAVKSYDEALTLDPDYVRALENRGKASFRLARFASAAEDFRKVINLDEKEDGSVRYLLAESYVELKEFRKAIVYYGEAMRRGKETPELYYKRGKSYAQIEDWGSALSDLNQAFNTGKKDADLFLERANVHIRMENVRNAMSDLNEAIAREQNHADAYFNRGYLHEINENWNEAITDYKKAVELNPDDDVAYYSLANSLVSQGNISAALKPIDAALGLDPANGNYYKVKGNILYRLDQNQKACENWRTAVEKGDVKAGYYLGEYCD